MKKILTLLFAALIYSNVVSAQEFSGNNEKVIASSQSVKMTEEEKVNFLINYLRHLQGAVFIRNGTEYSPDKAADHLLSKWNKHKKKVKTAQGFVDRLATSSKTDEPYQIRSSDGKVVKCGDLLNKELHRIEQEGK